MSAPTGVSAESADIPAPEAPRRRRGRPQVLDPEVERTLEAIGCYERKNSRRSRVDYSYMTDAMSALGMGKDERFQWLLGPETGRIFRPWRQSLLAELGRCGALYTAEDGPRIIRELARQLCDLRPSTRGGAALLRRNRRQVVGKQAKVSYPVQELADAVARAVDEYRAAHPDAELTLAECREAFHLAYLGIDEGEGTPEKGKRGR